MSKYKLYSDGELVSLLKEDDHSAYTEIYNRYSVLLYVHACKRLRDREEAKDLVQELFTSIWNNRFILKIDTHLSAYLYTAVRYQIIRLLSRRGLEAAYLDSLKETIEKNHVVTDYLVREKELTRIIEKEVDALPPKMRNVFYMSRHLHLSHREIADQLDLSEATVKKQVNNALKVLRVKLGILLSLLLLTLSQVF